MKIYKHEYVFWEEFENGKAMLNPKGSYFRTTAFEAEESERIPGVEMEYIIKDGPNSSIFLKKRNINMLKVGHKGHYMYSLTSDPTCFLEYIIHEKKIDISHGEKKLEDDRKKLQCFFKTLIEVKENNV